MLVSKLPILNPFLGSDSFSPKLKHYKVLSSIQKTLHHLFGQNRQDCLILSIIILKS